MLPVLRRVLYLTLFILEFNLVQISAKNFSADQHLIKNTPSAEDISFSSIPLLIHDIRRNIARSATCQSQHLSLLYERRQSKISNSQIPIILLRLKKQILRFQITMHHITLMYITQCTQQIPHTLPYQYLRYEKLLFDTLIQFTSTDVVED